MAELVHQRRGRRGNMEERGEVAIAVQGALPGRQVDPAHELLNWRGNHSGSVAKTPRERDQDLMDKLRRSGRIHARELSSFITPDGLLGQGEDVDPSNVDIRDIINLMARTRRLMLNLKLQKKGKIVAVEGARYLMIPPFLVEDVELIS